LHNMQSSVQVPANNCHPCRHR